MENKKPLLSFCIASYNRCDRIVELVNNILSRKKNDYEVVVVDNASTDQTVKKLKCIDNQNLRLIENEENIGGNNNMLKAIFAGSGKYAIYINDRDLVYMDHISDLIKVLKENDFSFLRIRNHVNTKELKIYAKGVESFLGQSLFFHPTGLVYNLDVIRNNKLNIDKYKKYEDTVYGYCFLMRQLLFLGNTAEYFSRIWSEDEEFKAKNISNFNKSFNNAYFMYDARYYHYKKIIEQIYDLSIEHEIPDYDIEKMVIYTNKYIYNAFSWRRNYYHIKKYALHYGLKQRYIPLHEIWKDFKSFNKNYIKEIEKFNCSERIIEQWKGVILRTVMKESFFMIKQDIRYLCILFGLKKYVNE